jgi:hypothetical protein
MQIAKRSGPFRTEMKTSLHDEVSTVNVATQSSPTTSHYCLRKKNASVTRFEQHENRTEAHVSIFPWDVHDNNKMIR